MDRGTSFPAACCTAPPTRLKLALAGNFVITVAKTLAYWHSGSSSMSSEAMHSLVDCANQALLLVGLRSASMAPDKFHQYGYGERKVRVEWPRAVVRTCKMSRE